MDLLPEHLDRDATVRARAISHFEALRARHGDVLHWEQIAAGFEFEGRRVHVASKACGIHTPACHRPPYEIGLSTANRILTSPANRLRASSANRILLSSANRIPVLA